MTVVELLENFVDAHVSPYDGQDDGAMSSDQSEVPGLARYLWSVVSELIRDAVGLPHQCHELFKLLRKLLFHLGGQVDLEGLASQVSKLLLKHETIEVSAKPLQVILLGMANNSGISTSRNKIQATLSSLA